MKMAKCLWNAYRWCFSCGQRSLKALWLEFRQITSYHYNLSISWEMAVHLRNKCFPKSSSYCVFARATNHFILHATPRPPTPRWIICHLFFMMAKKRSNLHFIHFFSLKLLPLRKILSFFPPVCTQECGILNTSVVPYLSCTFSSLCLLSSHHVIRQTARSAASFAKPSLRTALRTMTAALVQRQSH